jgi:hypothetical protein
MKEPRALALLIAAQVLAKYSPDELPGFVAELKRGNVDQCRERWRERGASVPIGIWNTLARLAAPAKIAPDEIHTLVIRALEAKLPNQQRPHGAIVSDAGQLAKSQAEPRELREDGDDAPGWIQPRR